MLQWLRRAVPNTAFLLPFSGPSLAYLIGSLTVTRLLVATARILANRPSQIHDPNYSETAKRRAFIERLVVEGGGTLGFVGSIHLAMDLASHLFERLMPSLKLPTLQTPELKPQLPEALQSASEKIAQSFDQAIHHVFGVSGRALSESTPGVIHRSLFQKTPDGHKINLASFQDVFEKTLSTGHGFSPEEITQALKAVYPKVEAFCGRLNVMASVVTGIGIVAGALFGGCVVQWANDRLLSRLIGRLAKNWGKDEAAAPVLRDSDIKTIETPKEALPLKEVLPAALPETLNVLSSASTLPPQSLSALNPAQPVFRQSIPAYSAYAEPVYSGPVYSRPNYPAYWGYSPSVPYSSFSTGGFSAATIPGGLRI